MIVFVGSVFSPYYRKAGHHKPDDHCAINVALYGPRAARWAMTEYAQPHISRETLNFQLGDNKVQWDHGRLVIDVNEVSTPVPRPLRGRITVDTEGLGQNTFLIDDLGRHRWRPLAPFSRVSVDFQDPDIQWSGDGYLDCNEGDEPLEDAFTFWDWSRTMIDKEKTAILYNTDMVSGSNCLSAFLVDKRGELQDIEPPAPAKLPRTPIFRIPRRTRAEEGARPRVVKTLEDTPFYSRSIIETTLFGKERRAIHESLAGPRLNSSIVQFMLPYRMPRRP